MADDSIRLQDVAFGSLCLGGIQRKVVHTVDRIGKFLDFVCHRPTAPDINFRNFSLRGGNNVRNLVLQFLQGIRGEFRREQHHQLIVLYHVQSFLARRYWILTGPPEGRATFCVQRALYQNSSSGATTECVLLCLWYMRDLTKTLRK